MSKFKFESYEIELRNLDNYLGFSPNIYSIIKKNRDLTKNIIGVMLYVKINWSKCPKKVIEHTQPLFLTQSVGLNKIQNIYRSD